MADDSFICKADSKCLISGYARSCKISVSYLPMSVIDIIFHFYPKMNGFKFVWKVKENDNTLTSFDSDPFYIGLPNKFFLRLHSPKTKKTKTNTNTNIVTFIVDHNTDDDPYPPLIPITDSSYYLTLLSFQLSPQCQTLILHIELYCHEINEQYSVIWNISEKNSKIQTGQRYDHHSQHMYPPHYYNNNTTNDIGINLMSLKWKLHNTTINQFLSTGLTFECKLNVLKIVKNTLPAYPVISDQEIRDYDYESIEYSNYDKMRFSWNVPNEYIFKLTHTNNILRDRPQQQMQQQMHHTHQYQTQEVYNATNSVELPNGISYHSDIYYDMFQLKVLKPLNNTPEWMIQLCGLPTRTNSIGVKWDIFAIDRNNKIKIISQIITFSYNMAVYNFSNDQNRMLNLLINKNKMLQLFCKANIVQKYDKKNKTNNNNNNHSYIIPTNTISNFKQTQMVYNDLYDNQNINQKIKKHKNKNKKKILYITENKQNDNEYNKNEKELLSKQISESQLKILQPKEDFFIWTICDQNIISKLQNRKCFGSIISDAFELFDEKIKFYISLQLINGPTRNYNHSPPGNVIVQQQQQHIYNVYNENQSIDISICNLNGYNSISLTVKISIHLIETGDIKEYFQIFHNNYNTFTQLPHAGYYLSIDREKFKKLNKLTIKINMKLIDYKNYHKNQVIQSQNDINYNNNNNEEHKTELILVNKKVKKWLCDDVKLPQYEALFAVNGIDDMEIVKSLNIEYIKSIGILLVGHQIKLLNAIKLLKND